MKSISKAIPTNPRVKTMPSWRTSWGAASKKASLKVCNITDNKDVGSYSGHFLKKKKDELHFTWMCPLAFTLRTKTSLAMRVVSTVASWRNRYTEYTLWSKGRCFSREARGGPRDPWRNL